VGQSYQRRKGKGRKDLIKMLEGEEVGFSTEKRIRENLQGEAGSGTTEELCRPDQHRDAEGERRGEKMEKTRCLQRKKLGLYTRKNLESRVAGRSSMDRSGAVCQNEWAGKGDSLFLKREDGGVFTNG